MTREHLREYYSGNLQVQELEGDHVKRWIAGVAEDMQIMGVRRWRNQCEETAE
jgi:hypothetical protein